MIKQHFQLEELQCLSIRWETLKRDRQKVNATESMRKRREVRKEGRHDVRLCLSGVDFKLLVIGLLNCVLVLGN